MSTVVRLLSEEVLSPSGNTSQKLTGAKRSDNESPEKSILAGLPLLDGDLFHCWRGSQHGFHFQPPNAAQWDASLIALITSLLLFHTLWQVFTKSDMCLNSKGQVETPLLHVHLFIGFHPFCIWFMIRAVGELIWPWTPWTPWTPWQPHTFRRRHRSQSTKHTSGN